MSQEEESGLFAFDFDDDVFITKEEKERVNVSNIEYQAKIDLDGVNKSSWLKKNTQGKLTSVQSGLLSKTKIFIV
jgi:hypothetical protein